MIGVSLRCLHVFVTAARHGSFSAASEELGISQPSVSEHVRVLERDVGGQVFLRRRGSKPQLTDLGRSVLDHAETLLKNAHDLQSDVMSIQTEGDQRVIFSCQRSLANFALNRALTEFALAHPDIRLVVRIGRQEDVLSDMRDGRADVGCFLSNDEHPGMVSRVIGREPLQFIAAPGHPLAQRKCRLKPADLAGARFVGPPPESHFGRAIGRLMKDMGIRGHRTVAQATEYQFLRELVAAEVGIACSPAHSVEGDVAAGRLRILKVEAPPLAFDIRLITSRTRARSEAMARLETFLAQTMGGEAAA